MVGIHNVTDGIKHEFEKLFGGDSLITDVFHSVVAEIKAYEEKNGKEDLHVALEAGKAAYTSARSAGHNKGESILVGVGAFFLSEAKDIKTISTEAAQAALSGYVKK